MDNVSGWQVFCMGVCGCVHGGHECGYEYLMMDAFS